MSYDKPYFPVIGARKNLQGDYTPVDKTEQHVVKNGYIRLKEVPYYDSEDPNNVKIAGFSEAFSMPPAPGTFVVNYLTGRIYFDVSHEGQLVTVEYRGIGSLTAVDEINYLWRLLSGKIYFTSLLDTPDSYSLNRFKYLRVNKSGTGIVFDAPSVGRSVSKIYVFSLASNEDVTFEGTDYDLINIYQKQPIDDKTELYTLENAIPEDNNLEYVSAEGYWHLKVPLDAGIVKYLEDNEGVDTGSWDRINQIYFDVEEIGDCRIKFLIKADDKYYAWSGNNFYEVSAFTSEKIQLNGISNDELINLSANKFEKFIGKKISFVASFKTINGLDTPKLKKMVVVGIAGGELVLDFTDIWHRYMPSLNAWKIRNDSSEVKDLVIVLGAGRDEVCCSGELFQYDDLANTDEIEIKAIEQTSVQVMVYEDDETVTQNSYTLPDDAHIWQTEEPLVFVESNHLLLAELDGAKSIENTGKRFHSIFKFIGGKVVDSVGNVVGDDLINGYSYKGISVSSLGSCLVWQAVFNGHGSSFVKTKFYLRLVKNLTENNSRKFTFGAVFRVGLGGSWPITWAPPQINIFSTVLGSTWYSRYGHLIYYRQLAGGAYVVRRAKHESSVIGWESYKALSANIRNGFYDYIDNAWVFVGEGFTDLEQKKKRLYFKTATSPEYIDNWGVKYLGWKEDLFRIGVINLLCFRYDVFVPLVWVGIEHTAQDTKDIMDYIEDKYYQFKNYYSNLTYSKFILKPSLDFQIGENLRNVTKQYNCYGANYHTGEYIFENPNRYLVELNGILYKWSGSEFVEVSKSLTDQELYNAGMDLNTLNNIPQSAWESMNVASFSLWVISYANWFRQPPHIDKRVTINATEVTADGWRVVQPSSEVDILWKPNRRVWKIKHKFAENKKIRVFVSGSSKNPLIPKEFTELLDTPDNIDYVYPQTLIGNSGRIVFIPYLNPYNFMKP